MAEEAKKDNKSLIIGICTALAVIIIAVVAIIFINKGPVVINDAYFVSDDSKLVLNIKRELLNEDEPYTPLVSHVVYAYSGETITDKTVYFEYEDNAAAQAAYDYLEEAEALSAFNSAKVEGKYFIYKADKEEYADKTVESVKEDIEFIKLLENASSDGSADEVVDEEVVEEEGE